MYRNELERACYEAWRLGLKREKALKHCAKVLGYKPLVDAYVESFRAVLFLNLKT